MDAVATQASTLLAKLEAYDFAKIGTLFSTFLQPFSPYISPIPQNPKKKPPKSKKPPSPPPPPPSIRSLAKTYLPYIHKFLVPLPKPLFETPKNPKTVEFLPQLLFSYKLCLDCLAVVSSELAGKPYYAHLHWARYARCLSTWERWEEGFDEAIRVLDGLGRIDLEGFRFRVTISKGELVPKIVECIDCDSDSDGGGNDKDGAEFVRLLVDMVMAATLCVSNCRSKDAGKYSSLLVLLREIRPWLRHLEGSERRKLQCKILAHMKNVSKFLIKEAQHFGDDLVSGFCRATFNEYTQMLNSGSLQGSMEDEVDEFVQFLHSFSDTCQSACETLRCAVAMHLYKPASQFSQDLIYVSLVQRLYALGLYLSEFRVARGSTSASSFGFLPEGWDKLQDLSFTLVSCKKYYHSNSEADVTFYLNALKFVCGPLAQLIYSEMSKIVKEDIDLALGNAFKAILEVFSEYCSLFLMCHEKEGGFEKIDTFVLKIVLASLTLSLKLFQNTKGSKMLVNHLLSEKCPPSLQLKMLDYLAGRLHNLFVEFHREKRLKEAGKAGKFCCKVSWNRCVLLCERAAGKLKGSEVELSENMIPDFVNGACKESSLLLGILHKIGSSKIDYMMVYAVEKWCLARNLFAVLLCPNALITDWVKIQCNLCANANVSAPILGFYLLCSPNIKKHKVSLETIGIILEQELLLYQELSSHCPKFCRRMQLEIIDVLLEKVHTLNKCMQRSIVLVKKALLSRSCEIGGLESCIDCLSEAIKSIDGSYGMTQGKVTSASHQLAILYCLRALSTQECDPSSKGIFADIRKAVRIWLKLDALDYFLQCNSDMGCEYVLLLLYHIADFLSIKGDTALHSDILEVIVKVLKQMNVSLDKCLALLWKSRRVNHALCVTPLNEALVVALSNCYGREAESLEFWINSVKDSRTLSVGLKQTFSFLPSFFPLAFRQHKRFLQSGVSVHEMKEVASELISNVSVSSSSAFLGGHILYDLSERLSASGKMIEALFYAKEAHKVRGKQLQEHFSYKCEQREMYHDEAGEATQKLNCVCQCSVLGQVAMRAWPNHSKTLEKSEGLILTPWNVLRSYLESTLQLGTIYEALGNVAEAQSLFVVGKGISSLQNLPLFIIAFSSCLGKVYRGKGLLDLAQKELVSAQKVSAAERTPDTCSRCSLMVESNLNEQLGNICRKGVLSAAATLYELSLKSLISLEKGDLTVWLEERDTGNDRADSGIKNQRIKVRADAKKSRKVKKELESQATVEPCAALRNTRVTRSRKQSSQVDGIGCDVGVQTVTNHYSSCQIESEVTSVSYKVDCEKCLLGKLKDLGSLTCLIRMKWEYVRRRQILRLLIGLGKVGKFVIKIVRHRESKMLSVGKCHGASPTNSLLHKIYLKCMSILQGGNDCHCSSSSAFELDSIGSGIPGDSLAHECAEVLYTFGWYFSEAFFSPNSRSVHHDVSSVQMSQVTTLLKHAFVLSREIPLLFQKVSRLLALIYLVSASGENLLSSGNLLSENYWAAYFHQAAVGTHYNLQLLSAFTEKYNSHLLTQVQGSQAAATSGMSVEMCTLLSIVPESTKEIEKYMRNFFQSLPDSAVVCISFLGKSYSSLLEGLLHCPSTIHGLMLLSHLTADNEPVVILLPVNSLVEDEETSISCSAVGENNACKEWRSPWGPNTLVDDIAPLFKSILRGNYLSCYINKEETGKGLQKWWDKRFSLDNGLQKLLREIEDSWFGHWKYLLLGRWLDAVSLIPTMKQLIQEIQEKFEISVNEDVFKVVMSGIKSTNLDKERIPSVFLEKGCYISSFEDFSQARCNGMPCVGADYIPGSVFAAVNKHEVEYCTRREPVVLVLDSNVQMLPLESMPIMREQEVYRMPSVASIFVALQRRSVLEEAGRLAAKFPLIDPLDAFYLLNPSGDLSGTQALFEDWFKSQNIQGMAGVIPSTTDWAAALENHDLFLYFGHGSGTQYMQLNKVKEVENCAATLLMGCSSGSLNMNGCYPPVGTPLSYIVAGAPIVIANLWEVTDNDIDRFSKAMLTSFMEERSMISTSCIQCSLLAEEFGSMNVNEKKGMTKKGRGKKKPTKTIPDVPGGYCFKHKLRAGYFVSQARKSCKLSHLIGAAPVCYGVPTGIRKKRERS